jgi:hypothetical protein
MELSKGDLTHLSFEVHIVLVRCLFQQAISDYNTNKNQVFVTSGKETLFIIDMPKLFLKGYVEVS